MKTYDVAIVGAGPAGMAAATRAVHLGLSAVVLDEQSGPGGQIYRAIEQADTPRKAALGADYAAGEALATAFRASKADYLSDAVVWNVDTDLTIDYSRGGASSQVRAGALVVATGAIERPTPLPGWTLPGVTTVGALQILLKANGVLNDDAVLVGCGPLLYLVAAQMVEAGAPPKAVVETVERGRIWKALPHLPRALAALPYLKKGLALIRRVKAAGVPIHRAAHSIRIEGEETVEAVRFEAGGREVRIPASLVALHQGVVPNQQVTRLLRCSHLWDDGQRCFVPATDACFETSVANVYVAGDGAGIGGAITAALRGELVALRIAEKAGKATAADRDVIAAQLQRDQSIRPFLEKLYAPSPEVLRPADDTLVCRCEEVTAGQVRQAVDLGAPGPNQVKSFLRCGMGPCQGRMCGLAVTEIIAERRGEPPSVVDYYRIRPPLKPLALSELAAIEGEPSAAEPL